MYPSQGLNYQEIAPLLRLRASPGGQGLLNRLDVSSVLTDYLCSEYEIACLEAVEEWLQRVIMFASQCVNMDSGSFQKNTEKYFPFAPC